jgi:hypothetical protein
MDLARIVILAIALQYEETMKNEWIVMEISSSNFQRQY